MKKLFFIAVLFLVVVGVYFTIDYNLDTPTSDGEGEVAGVATERGEIMEDKFFYLNNFYHTLEVAGTMTEYFQSDKIRAGIIPHDITQGQMMANFFQQLAEQSPTKIFLLGPNHYEAGETKLVTTLSDWQTKFGLVRSDDSIVSQLLTNPWFSEDYKIIENEHSVSAIIPYISYYLPAVQVIPIIFKADINELEIDSIIKELDKHIDDDTVIVSAVDFSHFLTQAEANKNDDLTQQYLTNLDYKQIFNLGNNFNDYLDSPAVIGLLLKWLENKEYYENQIIAHTNSVDELNNPNIPTTSYFEIIYY
ncbi:MAG: AmmeMemoRadiSam system protein B [bacterium]|nr:AmmeMemoRadiSam system protein B [bacterium]